MNKHDTGWGLYNKEGTKLIYAPGYRDNPPRVLCELATTKGGEFEGGFAVPFSIRGKVYLKVIKIKELVSRKPDDFGGIVNFNQPKAKEKDHEKESN